MLSLVHYAWHHAEHRFDLQWRMCHQLLGLAPAAQALTTALLAVLSIFQHMPPTAGWG